MASWSKAFGLALVIATSSCSVVSVPVHEDRYVSIAGIEQWVTVHGTDSRNPVLLMVHGGPGNPISPFSRSMFGEWEDRLTVVQWDQRGAGRTYLRNGEPAPSTMTVEQFAMDGVEVAEYIRNRLGVRKIILQGGSWGSIVGTHMVKSRPDLFHAYVGFAQVVNTRENTAGAYARVLELARGANDQETVSNLQDIGPPPWNAVRSFGSFRRATRVYEAKVAEPQPSNWRMADDYRTDADRTSYSAGEDFSFVQIYGETGDGPFNRVDLYSLGSDFDVPIHIVQGAEDLVTLPQIARRWFDMLSSPDKTFTLVPAAGHEPNGPLFDAMHKVLFDRVVPNTIGER